MSQHELLTVEQIFQNVSAQNNELPLEGIVDMLPPLVVFRECVDIIQGFKDEFTPLIVDDGDTFAPKDYYKGMIVFANQLYRAAFTKYLEDHAIGNTPTPSLTVVH